MRIIGLDYGDKTIGVAVSDPFGWTAQGLSVIRRENENEYKKSLLKLSEIIKEYEVEAIVLGYPKNLDNSEGDRCIKTNLFKEKLEKRFTGIPVILYDERFSTIAAKRILTAGNVDSRKQKGIIDKMAAVNILQGYLDRLKN